MDEPRKPRKPRKPSKPREFVYETRRSTYFSKQREQTLPEFVEYIVGRYAKKMKMDPEDVDVEDVIVDAVDGRFHTGKKVRDPDFNKKSKRYLKKLEKYEEKLKDYEDNLRKYEIELELYNAWLVRLKEDKVKNKMKKLERELEQIRQEKEALLEDKR